MINPRLTDRRRHHLTKLLKGSILILQSGKRQLLKVIGQISYALCLYYVINVIHLLYGSAHGLVEVCSLTVDPAVDIVTANENENIKLSQLRDTLLPKLMSDEIDVSDLEF